MLLHFHPILSQMSPWSLKNSFPFFFVMFCKQDRLYGGIEKTRDDDTNEVGFEFHHLFPPNCRLSFPYPDARPSLPPPHYSRIPSYLNLQDRR